MTLRSAAGPYMIVEIYRKVRVEDTDLPYHRTEYAEKEDGKKHLDQTENRTDANPDFRPDILCQRLGQTEKPANDGLVRRKGFFLILGH